ncbi:MAG: hypothetical protein F4X47_05205 [Gammaproteobacteria bacterium]|nr:hypothetical protein [Gammaproteobacteria bacterium]MYC51698.1 hypothetical protein [Gammaproteobacteria bacterium]
MNRAAVFGALTIVAAWAISPADGQAQSTEHGPLVLELPASTRGLALGGAFYMVGNDSDAVFHNPALIGGNGIIGGAMQRFGTASLLATVSGAAEWSSANVAVGVQTLSYGLPDRGAAVLAHDARSLFTNWKTGTAEVAVSVGFAREVRGVRAGITGKLVDQRLGGHHDATGAVDLGVAVGAGPARLGLAVQNLGPGLTLGEVEVPLPWRVTAGGSTPAIPVGPLDLGWTAAVSREADGAVVPGAGMEIAYWPVRGRTFTARFGVRRAPDGFGAPVTFGGAFNGDRLAIDYAWQRYDGGEVAHRFGLSWR